MYVQTWNAPTFINSYHMSTLQSEILDCIEVRSILSLFICILPILPMEDSNSNAGPSV